MSDEKQTHRLILKADKLPTDTASDLEKKEALGIYRKIVTLSCVQCCGVCGSSRYATKPFWCLGIRICKYCVEANLISNLVLYERFWVPMSQPVQGHSSLVEAVTGKAFYFKNRLTPNQRLEFSSDRLDFPGGLRTIWWFWKPHLEKILDFDELNREAALKHKAAQTVLAIVRRSLVLRILSRAKDNTSPTVLATMTSSSGKRKRKKDMRSSFFKLKKIELLDRVDSYNEQRMLMRLKPQLSVTLNTFEDRMIPLQLN